MGRNEGDGQAGRRCVGRGWRRVAELPARCGCWGFGCDCMQGERRRERRMEEELEAYARLDVRLPADGDGLDLARRVSRLVAEKSAFRRVAMLVRDAEGTAVCGGECGDGRRDGAGAECVGRGCCWGER